MHSKCWECACDQDCVADLPKGAVLAFPLFFFLSVVNLRTVFRTRLCPFSEQQRDVYFNFFFFLISFRGANIFFGTFFALFLGVCSTRFWRSRAESTPREHIFTQDINQRRKTKRRGQNIYITIIHKKTSKKETGELLIKHHPEKKE